jgi:hypothetical protein
MMERHSFAPGSLKDDGGDDGVASTAILLMAKILTLVLVPGKISKSFAEIQGAPRPTPMLSNRWDPRPGERNPFEVLFVE